MHFTQTLGLLLLSSIGTRCTNVTLDIPIRREYFYVGGQYTNLTWRGSTNQVMINQIYVERMIPPNPSQPYPIVFVPGGAQTGTNLLETPDGRPGWLHYFASRGYTVYLTDQPARGRSFWHPTIGSIAVIGAANLSSGFTASHLHRKWPQSYLHTQWPGAGVPGDPIFDTFFATQVQIQVDMFISEAANRHAYSALLDKIGPAYVMTHSQSGPYGWTIADARPKLVKGVIALEPGGPPFEDTYPGVPRPARRWGLTDNEIEYEPSAGVNGSALRTVRRPAKNNETDSCLLQAEPAKKLKNLSQVPVLVVTSEAGFHQLYEYCTVDYLRQGGVEVEFADLGKEGIHGNNHFMFMEKNNLVIAERIHRWLKKL